MTKPENIAAIVVMAVVAAVASAKTTEEEIRELKAEIAANSVMRTPWRGKCPYVKDEGRPVVHYVVIKM